VLYVKYPTVVFQRYPLQAHSLFTALVTLFPKTSARKNNLMKLLLVFALGASLEEESLVAMCGCEANVKERMVCTDMCSQKHCYPRPLQVLIEPGPGSLAVGYVCARSVQDYSVSLALQKRRIAQFTESKGWKLARWYKELEEYGAWGSVPFSLNY